MRPSPVPHDTRLRLIAASLIVLALSQLQHLGLSLATLLLVFSLALIEGLKPGAWRRLFHAELFVLLLLVTMPFAIPGEPLFSIGIWNVSKEGVVRAGLLASKVSAAVLLLAMFLGEIEPARFGATLKALRMPERLVRLLVMTVRYIFVFRSEAERLQTAMKARAFTPGTNRHTWTSYGYLIGMLLVRSQDRARRVENAMICRGYQGHFPYMDMAAPDLWDWVTFTGLSASAVALLIFDKMQI